MPCSAAPLDALNLPLISRSGPSAPVWQNPAPIARARGIRVWATLSEAPSGDGTPLRSIGISVPVGLGLPLFCTADIPPLARKAGVEPALAAALVAVESSFNPRAVSRTGARGLAQLTASTARSLGVYNRHWPHWNLWGGLTYLAGLQKRFGDDDLALAAYNVGPTHVARKGNTVLNDPEVARYVSRIQMLRKAYAKRYPTKCAQGGNAVSFAMAEEGDNRWYALGWGLDVQAIMELGLGITIETCDDSTTQDPMVGGRIYLIDPLFVAGTYRWQSQRWSVGGLVALYREQVQLGAQFDQDGDLQAGAKLSLPLGLGLELTWREEALALSLWAEADMWSLGFTERMSDAEEGRDRASTYSIFISLGKSPSL